MSKIAVIGMSSLFPGSKNNEEFWQNLIDQKDCRSKATTNQMGTDPEAFFDKKKGEDDKYYCMDGGYIQDFSMDAEGFNLQQEQLDSLDDMFKWSLYAAREALKDSGYIGNQAVLDKCGVILGNLSFPTKSSNQIFLPIYHKAMNDAVATLLDDDGFVLPRFTETKQVLPQNALIAGYPAALIAQALSLKGTQFALDAACASSLYSAKLACDYLTTGRADIMLAGAVSGADPLFVNMGFSIFQAYPENGISAPLDTRSQGLFAGEGAGMLVLKRYEDAVRDGDNVYATICGGGLSNDGKGQFVLSPNTKGQVLAYERAYKEASLTGDDVDYIECHATGTPLGDKVELTSMETFFSGGKRVPYIGSVKSNLGHLLTAAGMPGMIKVIMGMKNDLIPATINVQEPQQSPKQTIAGDQIISTPMAWPKNRGNDPKRAGVSVFGFGGANAHLIFEEENKKAKKAKKSKKAKASNVHAKNRMAIVGMDAYFGECDSLEEFDKTNYEGRQHFIPLPTDRWKGLDQDPSVLEALKEIPKGAYIDQFDLDFLRFKIPPNEDDRLIPQQLLLLKVADRALQDAKIEPSANVAVLVAMGIELELHQFRGRVNLQDQFPEAWKNSSSTLDGTSKKALEDITKGSLHGLAKLNQYTSSIGNIMASRVSSLWDFTGPAFTVSAEENSVFRAIEIAQLLFDTSDVEAVVVGAIDLAGSLENVLLRNTFGPVAQGKMSLSIEKDANGWQVGEGAGAIVLKRTTDATEQKDAVYANIDAIGFEMGSDAGSMSVACKKTLEEAQIKASDIEYIEMYGSGFADQDSAELGAMLDVYKVEEGAAPRYALGSVKSTVGHTFNASGIASIIKTALCLNNRYIPATPQWTAPKDVGIDWQTTGFYVPTESKTWLKNKDEGLRRAAINGLGMDGASCHLVLSESEEPVAAVADMASIARPVNDAIYNQAQKLIALRGNSLEEFKSTLTEIQDQLAKNVSMDTIAITRYRQFSAASQTTYSLALVASSAVELGKEIAQALKGIEQSIANGKDWASPNGSAFTANPMGKKGKLTYVYPGAFNSYTGLGKDLFYLLPELHPYADHQSSRIATLIGDHIFYPRSMNAIDVNERRQYDRTLTDTPINMFENGISHAVTYTDIMRDIFKVKASTAFGYSMGEVSMMYALGVWGKTDHMSDILRSTPVFQTRLAGPMETLRDAWDLPKESVPDNTFWSGFTVQVSPSKMLEAINGEEYMRLILINSPNEVVIAGKPEVCKKVLDKLGVDFVAAALGDVIHCDMVRADYEGLCDLHKMPVAHPEGVKFFTAVGYKPLAIDSDGIANNIAEMYCNHVDFPKLVNTVYDDGNRIFLELGPRDGCTRNISTILGDKEHVAIAVNRKGSSDYNSLIRAFAKLVSHQVDMDLSRLYRATEEENKPKRQLVKEVKIGSEPLQQVIINDENITKYRGKSTKPNLQAPVATATAPAPVKAASINVAPIKVTKPAVMPTAIKPISISSNSNKTVKEIKSMSTRDNNNKLAAKQAILNAASASGEIDSAQLEQYRQNMSSVSSAHSSFLESRRETMQSVAELIAMQAAAVAGGTVVSDLPATLGAASVPVIIAPVPAPVPTPVAALVDAPVKQMTDAEKAFEIYRPAPIVPRPPQNKVKPEGIIWDEADMIEFAEGNIANVFGKDFAIIDTYERRVRLPTTEYLLVSRVTKLDATPGKYEPCSITTEFDIPHDAWFAVDGQIPWAVSVESGQCDLLLISYLGIDFENKGEFMYRLLDCTLTFMDDIPKAGDTLVYDIKINHYARNGNNLLFFFSYECFVGDKMVLKMDGGAAGFFNEKDLADGKGVIETPAEKKVRLAIEKQHFTPYLNCPKTSYDYEDMLALCRGDLPACFGNEYDQGGLNSGLVFSAPKMLMIERVTKIDLHGGSWGLGLIEGEKTLDPGHWYFPCHFKGDQVMAGSLMSDGCGQLLRFFTYLMGFQTKTTNAVFQPIPNLPQQVRCRGQVRPQHNTLTYRMEITEIGMEPTPFAKANIDIILDGRIVVDFKNLGLYLKEGDIAFDAAAIPDAALENNVPQRPESVFVPGLYPMRPAPFKPFPGNPLDTNFVPDTVPYTDYHFTEFATGRIANCFGEEFACYDGRTPPRTPNADLQLTTRVIDIVGTRHDLKTKATATAEYDVPADAWYYTENNHESLMPYSILMEIALQPCGFISAWVGTTLQSPETDLFFRNLDGNGEILREVDLRGKTITNVSSVVSTVTAGNTIIQSFEFALSVEGEVFYKGTAVFGYFLAGALEHQLGMDKGVLMQPWHHENKVDPSSVIQIDMKSQEARSGLYDAKPGKPFYRLAGPQLDFVDTIDIVENNGIDQKGFVHAEKVIIKDDWFFPCHFHQDPVMPGSLGVEAMMQCLQVFMLKLDLGSHLTNPRFDQVTDKISWKYRGQIIPANKVMTLNLHIKEIIKTDDSVQVIATGNLYKDGLRIYELADLTMRLVEA